MINQNIFREYDIRGIVGRDLTDDAVSTIARAVGTFFNRNNAKRIAVGYDARESGTRFRDLFVEGLNESGCDAVLVGRVPTPVLYHTVFTQNVDGGVMITGSHNPADFNGFKLCLGKSTIYGAQIQEIKQIARGGEFVRGGNGSLEKKDVTNDYLDFVCKDIQPGNRKLKVVVDAGNGVGGVIGAPLYKKLGFETIDLFIEPDSSFPNHHPDPTVLENMRDAVEAVERNNADLAIAFDGDGDRIGVVDEKGRVIWGDELMVIFARSILEKQKGATFIAEVKCSQRLYDDIERRGGRAIMWKAGHSLIKAKMKETSAALAGEMSGHIFFADRFFGFDDAIYSGARLLEILSNTNEPLSSLLLDLPEVYNTPEIRIDCLETQKFEVVRRIAEYFRQTNEVIDIDGARILFPNGWALVRASNTQAILVLRFEADSRDRLEGIQRTVETQVHKLIKNI